MANGPEQPDQPRPDEPAQPPEEAAPPEQSADVPPESAAAFARYSGSEPPPPPPGEPPTKRRSRWIWVCGLLALACVGLLVWALSLNSDLDDANAKNEQAAEAGSSIASA